MTERLSLTSPAPTMAIDPHLRRRHDQDADAGSRHRLPRRKREEEEDIPTAALIDLANESLTGMPIVVRETAEGVVVVDRATGAVRRRLDDTTLKQLAAAGPTGVMLDQEA